MGKNEKQAYLKQIYKRYQKANKSEKSLILNEFCAVCGYHRKHALRLLKKGRLQRRTKAKPQETRGRQPRYEHEKILPILKTVWKCADFMCSKRLKAALPEWLPHYPKTLDTAIEQQLLSISAASIDRLLKPFRAQNIRKGLSGTRPGSLLKNQIPIKTHHWDVSEPGFLEADTVAHCGNSLAGDFVWSLTMTDILTTWTECRATWNKGAHGVCEQVKSIEDMLPFPIQGFDCDNGSEFLNYHLIRYFTDEPRKHRIAFTRSRPYHKDDNAHVEQKNWTHVRQLFGYDRLDNPKLVELMNDLYANEWSLYQNHFCPTNKLVEKIKINSKYRRKYDKPKTPFQRLLECEQIDQETKTLIQNIHQKLNPFQLKNDIEKKLKTIFAFVTISTDVRARI